MKKILADWYEALKCCAHDMASPEPAFITPNKPVLPPIQHYSRNSCSPRISPTPDPLERGFYLHRPNSSARLQKIAIGKKATDTVRTEPVLLPCISSDPLLRITQLEQNLHFLQDQHHIMLASLHQEIEALRLRNRDLQFQLIFGNAGVKIIQSSSDSSPDDAVKPKIILSPKEVNNRSLQVEMLEKEVTELKASLAEANSKNASLIQLIDHQKKQLEAAKKDYSDSDSFAKLEDAENLIKRLIKENEEQRKEMVSIRSQLNKGGNGRYSGGSRRGAGSDHQRFPPLQTQNFWGHGSQKHHKSSPEYQGNRGSLEHEVVGQAAPTLPHLNRSFSQSNSSNQRHRYYSNGNHHFYRGNSEEGGDGRRRYRGRGSAHHKEDN